MLSRLVLSYSRPTDKKNLVGEQEDECVVETIYS